MPADRMPAAALRVVGEVAARGLAILPRWQGNDHADAGDQLANGLKLSIRLRRDFTVTDAGRLLAAARRMYQGLDPGSTVDDAEAMVSSAADALYCRLGPSAIASAPVMPSLCLPSGSCLAERRSECGSRAAWSSM
jgi:hypothetical protein